VYKTKAFGTIPLNMQYGRVNVAANNPSNLWQGRGKFVSNSHKKIWRKFAASL
jgi:hypothetical protein